MGGGELPTHVAGAAARLKSGMQAGRLGAAQDGTRATGGRWEGASISRQKKRRMLAEEGASIDWYLSSGTSRWGAGFEAWALWLDEEGEQEGKEEGGEGGARCCRCALLPALISFVNAARHRLRPSRRRLPEKLLRSVAHGGRISLIIKRPAGFSHSTWHFEVEWEWTMLQQNEKGKRPATKRTWMLTNHHWIHSGHFKKLQHKNPDVTAYHFGAASLLSCIVDLAEFSDFEFSNSCIQSLLLAVFVCAHSSDNVCPDRPPSHRCHEQERDPCNGGSNFTSAVTAVILDHGNARIRIWTFDHFHHANMTRGLVVYRRRRDEGWAF
jgi:hypothetical protein